MNKQIDKDIEYLNQEFKTVGKLVKNFRQNKIKDLNIDSLNISKQRHVKFTTFDWIIKA